MTRIYELLKILKVIIRFEENKNIVNIMSLKSWFESLMTTVQPVFLMVWKNALAREGPRGDHMAAPSVCLLGKPLNIK